MYSGLRQSMTKNGINNMLQAKEYVEKTNLVFYAHVVLISCDDKLTWNRRISSYLDVRMTFKSFRSILPKCDEMIFQFENF